MRFEAIAPPELVYQPGYHDGANDFGWSYTDSAQHDYEITLAHRRLRWVERSESPGRMVDIGGGAGYLVAAASERGWEATLVEPVASTVAFAASRLGVDAVCGGIEHVEEGPDRYDLVSLVHVLEHFPHPVEHLRRLRARLADGGALFVEVPNYASLARRLLGDRWMGWRSGEHVHLFTRRTLTATLTRAGFDVVACRTMVPAWNGLGPGANAHFLGVEPVLETLVERRHRRARGRTGPETPGPGTSPAWQPPPPRAVRDERGVRRLLYEGGFAGLRRIEEAAGVGTNLLAVARPIR